MDLTKFRIVKITDYTHYRPSTCSTGGDYSYTTTYKRISSDKWEREKSTSASFTYCYKCGDFSHDGEDCYLSDEDCIVNTETVLQAINGVENPHICEDDDVLDISYDRNENEDDHDDEDDGESDFVSFWEEL